jgi:HEPN domain-containing protein
MEKILKTLVVKASKTHAPYTHSLPLLAQRSGLKIPNECLDRLSEFMEFHIESRYPDATEAFYKKCTEAVHGSSNERN